MIFGLSEAQYDYISKIVVHPLESMGATVWCYGSRARGDYKNFSDLDLMVESTRDLSKHLNQIKEKLQNENFPFKVDLVQLSEFAESSINFEPYRSAHA